MHKPIITPRSIKIMASLALLGLCLVYFYAPGSASHESGQLATTVGAQTGSDSSQPSQAAQLGNGPGSNWKTQTELSPGELQELQGAVADHPERDAELARLIDYAKFQKQTALWRDLHDGPLTPERKALGEHLLQVLPMHYERGEVMGPQAYVMAQTLIRDIEPDAKKQSTRLDMELARLKQAAAPADETQVKAQLNFEKFQQRQQAIVSEYEALPAAQKDPRQLEARLDAERQAWLQQP